MKYRQAILSFGLVLIFLAFVTMPVVAVEKYEQVGVTQEKPRSAVYNFSNPTPLIFGAATTASTITVSGVVGNVIDVNIILHDFQITDPGLEETDVLLVPPAGAAADVILLSFACDTTIGPVTLTLDMSAAGPAPDGDSGVACTNGSSYTPGDHSGLVGGYILGAPSPAPPYSTDLGVLNGTNPNGVWTLYGAEYAGDDPGQLTWEIVITDDYNPVTLSASAICNVNNLAVTVNAGDTPVNITGTGPGLPLNGVGVGTHPLTGPGTWTGVTVTETAGDAQSVVLGDFTCSTIPADVSAVCVANNLVLTITGGDVPFNITGTGPGLPLNGVGVGTHPLTGPGTWTGVTATETTGDTQTTNLGNFTCSTTAAVVTAQCVGDNLSIVISSGDAPFNITGTGPGLPLNGVAAGTYTLTGPGAWTGLTVVETTGDTQTTLLGDVTCQVVVVVVPGIPVPNLGLVKIDTGQAQPVYESPNGGVIRISGAEVWLPHDADGNGFDTYIVTEIHLVDGEIWLGLFIGGVRWGYVPLAHVTQLTPLPLVEADTTDNNSGRN